MQSTAALSKRDLISVRDYVPDDRNFIMSTWLKGLRYGNDWFKLIESDVYFAEHQRVIERILDWHATSIRVACLADSPDVILGYSVVRGTCLDWVFCKRAWRGIGIAKMLVDRDTLKTVSHLTEVGRALLKKLSGVTFDPYH